MKGLLWAEWVYFNHTYHKTLFALDTEDTPGGTFLSDAFFSTASKGFYLLSWNPSNFRELPYFLKVNSRSWFETLCSCVEDSCSGFAAPRRITVTELPRCHVPFWWRSISRARSRTTVNWRVRTVSVLLTHLPGLSELLCKGLAF